MKFCFKQFGEQIRRPRLTWNERPVFAEDAAWFLGTLPGFNRLSSSTKSHLSELT
jgi:hypothetical protein